jgi:broad specificity phosphatase PhoE
MNSALSNFRPQWLHEPPLGAGRILFARHAEYECNVAGVANCDPSRPLHLTPRGELQAEALGRQLAHERIDVIICSQFIRARETAALANGSIRRPIIVNALANENRVGRAFEGKPHEDFFASIAHDPVDHASPDGGESFAAFLNRLQRLIADIVRSDVQTTLVVAHGWTLQAARHLLGQQTALEAAMGTRGLPANCAVVDGLYCVNPSTGLGESFLEAG